MRSRKLRPIKAGCLRDQVKDAVRDAIFQGRFQPGDPLRELGLAHDLRVSQATVREALLQLEQTGLVVRVPNKQTIVTQLSQQDLKERIIIRILLEEAAAVEAARRIGPKELEELERRLEAIDRAVSKNAYFELAQADLEFHRYIWWQAGNTTLARMLDNLTAPLFTFTSILRSKSKEDLRSVVGAHGPIVAALGQGHAATTKRTIREHIEGSYEQFLTSDWEDFQSLVRSRKLAAFVRG
jgi:DNA-binding GntR family transcriptional regulator